MSSIHLRTGRPGRLSLSTIPNTNDFSSRSSGILHMAEQLKLSLSQSVHHCSLQLHLSSDFKCGPAGCLAVCVYNTASQMPTVYAVHLSSWSTFLMHIVVPQRRTSLTTDFQVYHPLSTWALRFSFRHQPVSWFYGPPFGTCHLRDMTFNLKLKTYFFIKSQLLWQFLTKHLSCVAVAPFTSMRVIYFWPENCLAIVIYDKGKTFAQYELHT